MLSGVIDTRFQMEDVDVGYGITIPMTFGSTEAAFRSTDDATGTMRWHASVLLGALLAKTRICAEAAVVELGCGASLPSAVAARTGACSVHITDASPAALELGLLNVSRSASPACVTSSAVLEWSHSAGLAPLADVVLSSENLYVYRASHSPAGERSALEEQATDLFTCSRHLMVPGGVMLGVYTPRYRGMSARVDAGASSAGLFLRRIDHTAVMTDAMASSLRFGRTRLFIAATERSVIDTFLEQHGLLAGPALDHESDSDDDDACGSGGPGGQGLLAADLFD